MRRGGLLLVLLAFIFSAEAQAPKKFLMRVTPRPTYPEEAIARHITGCGRFQIEINQTTGAASKVIVLQSAGHPALNRAAVNALIQWRTWPGTIQHAIVPVCFDFRFGKPTVNY